MTVKAFRKQRQTLSLLPATSVKAVGSDFEVGPAAIRDSFHGWLNKMTSASVSPVVSISAPVFRIPRLSIVDVMRVNQATIREGESHCIWPPSVVMQFKTAKIITEKKAKHYQLKDTNLRKIC